MPETASIARATSNLRTILLASTLVASARSNIRIHPGIVFNVAQYRIPQDLETYRVTADLNSTKRSVAAGLTFFTWTCSRITGDVKKNFTSPRLGCAPARGLLRLWPPIQRQPGGRRCRSLQSRESDSYEPFEPHATV